ncbi:MAG: ArsC family reductase [Ectothiorhodospiraceae bacterium]|nr:ArsC family reductase [Ectothiorhodospiraceae bacterium]
MTTLYGIKNCDTVRKARKWLDAQNIEFTFHDVRSDGLNKKDVCHWVKAVGWETLLNRRGTTWRKLPDADKEGVNEKRAIDLMLAQPTLIKRPVLVLPKSTHVGFKPAEYEGLFK